jgi:hypothetical protein
MNSDDIYVLNKVGTPEVLTIDGQLICSHDYLFMSTLRLRYEVKFRTHFEIKPIRKALIHATS